MMGCERSEVDGNFPRPAAFEWISVKMDENLVPSEEEPTSRPRVKTPQRLSETRVIITD